VRQTRDLDIALASMARALEWHHHLFAAEAYEAADDIVNAVWGILNRWVQRDRAKALLRESIATLEGFNKAVAQGNLATMLIYEDKLDEALATYEAVYQTFEALDAWQQIAAVLAQISQVYQLKGEIDQGIAKQNSSLQLQQQRGNKQGQAISLHGLSMLYTLKEDYATALGHSEEAEKLALKLGDNHLLAASLHQQGIILTDLARTAQSDEERRTHLQVASERFQSSLELLRRIGDEAGAADPLVELGTLLVEAGRMREAIAAFTEALATYTQLGSPARIGKALERLGFVHERQGEYKAALEKYQQVLKIVQQYSSPQDQAIIEHNIARVQAKLRGAG